MRGPGPITLYDEAFPYKFDSGGRDKPDSKLFRDHDEFANDRKLNLRHDSIIESAILAHLNLRTRHLIGLALGSAVGDLIEQPANVNRIESYGTHKDLDVLILDPFSSNCPAPTEWGVDWWVRPSSDTTMPTNGRTTLWYDVRLNPAVSTIKERVSKKGCPLSFQLKERAIRLDHRRVNRIRNEIQKRANKLVLAPGLYLPHPQTMRQIVDVCHEKIRGDSLKEKIEQLENRIEWIGANAFRKADEIHGSDIVEGEGEAKPKPPDWDSDAYLDTSLKEGIKLAKEIENELNELENQFNILNYFAPLDRIIENKRKSHPGVSLFDAIKPHLARKLMEIQRGLQELRRDNYSYLLINDITPDRQLFPIMPPEAVTITPTNGKTK